MEIEQRIPGKVILTENEATEIRDTLSNLANEARNLPEVWNEYVETADYWIGRLTDALVDME